MRFGVVEGVLQRAREAKVAQLDTLRHGGVQENVGRFEVAMQDRAGALGMAFLQRRGHFRENFPDELLVRPGALAQVIPNDARHVPATAVLHHDVDLLRLAVDDAVVVANDVLVRQLAQDVDFAHQLFLLLRVHCAVVQFLPNQHFAILDAHDLVHFA
jgi:hypothetical protein